MTHDKLRLSNYLNIVTYSPRRRTWFAFFRFRLWLTAIIASNGISGRTGWWLRFRATAIFWWAIVTIKQNNTVYKGTNFTCFLVDNNMVASKAWLDILVLVQVVRYSISYRNMPDTASARSTLWDFCDSRKIDWLVTDLENNSPSFAFHMWSVVVIGHFSWYGKHETVFILAESFTWNTAAWMDVFRSTSLKCSVLEQKQQPAKLFGTDFSAGKQ